MRFPLNHAVLPVSVAVLCLLVLSGCRFLIPEDPSAPRYNTVLGGKRVPERNREVPPGPSSQAPSSYTTSSAASYSSGARQSPAYAAPVEPAQERGFWDRMAFWRSDDTPSAPPPPAAAAPRQMPVENASMLASSSAYPAATPAYQASPAYATPSYTSNSNAYPQLSTVPPRPDADAARLSAVRAQLEQERMAAGSASANLSAAAAAEPSLLAPMPEPVAVSSLPPPPQPMISSPPPPTYQPAPAPATAMEPIRLRPPVPEPTSQAPAYNVAPQAMAPAAAGSFNPMASAPAPGYYGTPQITGYGYLPDSRYAPMRTQ